MSGSGPSERPPWEQTRRVPASPPWGQAPTTPGNPSAPGAAVYQVPGANPYYQGQPMSGYGQQPYASYPGQVPGYPPGYGAPYMQPFGGTTGWVKPHRGVLVLVLAVCSFALCFICGIIAFFMARADLEEMRQGIMDPSGEQMTKVAYWVSLGHMCLMAFVFVVYVGLMVVVAATSP